MRLLALDTSVGLCTVAVFMDGATTVLSQSMTRGHQEALAPMAEATMARAGLGFADLDGLGVTVGPGSFTGLRVGLAFAQGLGSALDLPVVGISTLDALAASAPEDGMPTAALIDARRGQVYARLFDGRGVPLDEAAATPLDAVADRLGLAGAVGRLVGTGVDLVAALAPDWVPLGLEGPMGEALIRLTQVGLTGGDPAAPRPQYLRAPDATPPTRLPGQPRPLRS